MSEIGHILDGVLSDGERHNIIGNIKIHSFFFALASSTIFAIEWYLDLASLRVETLIQLETHSFLPSIKEMVLGEGSKFDVALVGEINKL